MIGDIIQLDDTAIKTIRSIFNARVSQESKDINLDSFSKSLRMKELQNKIISVIENNPISNFKLIFPGETTGKNITVEMSNFSGKGSAASDITVEVDISWEEAKVFAGSLRGKAILLVTLNTD